MKLFNLCKYLFVLPTSGNWLIDSNNKVYFYDCSCFYGASEFDIAAQSCFLENQELPESFWKGYDKNPEYLDRFHSYYSFFRMCTSFLTGNTKMMKKANVHVYYLAGNIKYEL